MVYTMTEDRKYQINVVILVIMDMVYTYAPKRRCLSKL